MTQAPKHFSRRDFLASATLASAAFQVGCGGGPERAPAKRPNILLAYSDDISWLHKGAYGTRGVETPVFDRIAKEGVLFNHSYTAAPSCTPSRSCTLTGQQLWRVAEAGVLIGTFPSHLEVYPRMLEAAGYHTGYTGKGWGPGDFRAMGRELDPCGEQYSEQRYEPGEIREGINPTNYAENFRDFLAARPEGSPFCFWFGCYEAHRAYAEGAGLEEGKRLEDVDVPEFFPDTEEIRSDILDYYVEIEWFDRHLGRMIAMLEEAGELDNTIVVATSDNGMPFPRCKTTLYDWGVRMPLAIRWGDGAPGGRVVDDFVHHTDFAPTFLEAAGLPVPEEMTGRSLVPLLASDKQGQVEPVRDFAVTAIERHTWCRPDGKPYPSRMIRTKDYLYIRNYEPDRWPAGDPDFDAVPQGPYGDIDRCPTKTFMMENKGKHPREFELGFGKRPGEELFLVADDPYQVRNLADDPAHSQAKQESRKRLEDYLVQTNDPRSRGESPWDDYPYYSRERDPRRKA